MTTTAARPRRFYGWKKDRHDKRDLFFRPMAGLRIPAPTDLRPGCPAVMDQSTLGSCVEHGSTGVVRFNRIRQGLGDLALSRLQLYWDVRSLEGTIDEDAGGEIRDAIKCLARNGVAPESIWPYDVSRFREKPPAECYDLKGETLALEYRRVEVDPYHIRAALAIGRPVIVGIEVFKGFESDEATETGIVPLPKAFETPIGGHCMYLPGFGQKQPSFFTSRNSWGAVWGDGGDCYLHEDYIASPKFASDFWLVNSVAVSA